MKQKTKQYLQHHARHRMVETIAQDQEASYNINYILTTRGPAYMGLFGWYYWKKNKQGTECFWNVQEIVNKNNIACILPTD